MIELLPWAIVIALAVAGLAALGRKKPISDEEYRKQRGKGVGLGNALLAFHEILEPQRGQVKKAQEERKDEEKAPGDPPQPGEQTD